VREKGGGLWKGKRVIEDKGQRGRGPEPPQKKLESALSEDPLETQRKPEASIKREM